MQIVDIRLTKLLFRVHKPDKSEGRDFYSLCVSLNSCEKICVGTVLFVDPGYLILVAEVVDADQLFFGGFSYQGKESLFPRFPVYVQKLQVQIPDGWHGWIPAAQGC